jgi:NTP pyrophosphatase (non-canonical NTP hydrolase)
MALTKYQPITTDQFTQLVAKHSAPMTPSRLLYLATALAGEVGEACNQVKKFALVQQFAEWRDKKNPKPAPHPDLIEGQIIEELSDALFYLVALADQIGVPIERLFQIQADKLAQQSADYGRTFLK